MGCVPCLHQRLFRCTQPGTGRSPQAAAPAGKRPSHSGGVYLLVGVCCHMPRVPAAGHGRGDVAWQQGSSETPNDAVPQLGLVAACASVAKLAIHHSTAAPVSCMRCYDGPCVLPRLCLCFIEPLLQLLLQLARCGRAGVAATVGSMERAATAALVPPAQLLT